MVEEGSSLYDVLVIATKEIAQAQTEQGYAPSKPNDTIMEKPNKTNPSTIQTSVSEINQEWSFSTKHFATPVLLDKSLSNLLAQREGRKHINGRLCGLGVADLGWRSLPEGRRP